MAVVEDLLGRTLEGSFYAEMLQEIKGWEMQKIPKNILKEDKKKKLVFVNYVGWPPEFKEWIPKKDVEDDID